MTANVTSVSSGITGSCHSIFHVTSFIDWMDNCNNHDQGLKEKDKANFQLRITSSMVCF